MTEARALDILLGDERVGTIVALDGDRSIFSFAQSYVHDEGRSTLSLAIGIRTALC